GPTLARLAADFGARRAEPLYCSVDPKRHRRTSDPICWDLGYLGTYSSDRQATLDALLLEPARRMPDRRFV
ncbi:MAG: glycosyltransferase, partial [Mesorhizobium sp.]